MRIGRLYPLRRRVKVRARIGRLYPLRLGGRVGREDKAEG